MRTRKNRFAVFAPYAPGNAGDQLIVFFMVLFGFESRLFRVGFY